MFDGDDILIESSMMADDMMNGESILFHSNGAVEVSSTYKNDTISNVFAVYDENSNLLDTNILIQGSGDYKLYHSNNTLSYVCQYENGIRNGQAVLFDSIGNKKIENNYLNDKKNGKSVMFYSSNKVFSESEYIEDVIVGEFREYYETGSLKSLTVYKYPPFNKRDSIELGLIKTSSTDLLGLIEAFSGGADFNGIIKQKTKNFHTNGKLRDCSLKCV